MAEDLASMKLDVTLRVSDLAASVAWYAKVFATEPIYRGVDRSESGKSLSLVCFRLGGVKIWLAPGGNRDGLSVEERRYGPTLAFMTSQDLASLRRTLEARGAEFDDESPTPDFPINEDGIRIGVDSEFLWIDDPDRYRLEFCRVYKFRQKDAVQDTASA